MILRELTIRDKAMYEKYFNDWGNETIIPESTDLNNYKNFEDMVDKLTHTKTIENDNYIPNTTLFLVYRTEILGAVNIRFYLNDELEKNGGHINFGVSISNRGNGYARLMTRYAMDYLESLGVNEALLTTDDDNAASIKTILNSNGREVEPVEIDDKTIRRFWLSK